MGCSHERPLIVRGTLARLWACRRGVNAVEFAIIAPFMLTLLLGTTELSNAMQAHRKVTAVTSSIGDLVAQAKVIDNQDIADVFSAGEAIMVPFDVTPLEMVISSVVADQNGQTKVAWSDGYRATPRTVDSSYALPEGLVTANQSVIVAEVRYAYTSPLNKFIAGSMDMEDTFFLKPRRTTQVVRQP
ncbi:MAG: pilus assembly protein [Alphaproteobacteria bacterium]|nr:pilus assembly protein [Alphaproteobacteria bacterium]